MDAKIAFLQELHDLLAKYNAEISIGLDGDTHGLDSWIDIQFRQGTSFIYEEVGKFTELSQYDLKHFLTK
jgi:hypothetical protein